MRRSGESPIESETSTPDRRPHDDVLRAIPADGPFSPKDRACLRCVERKLDLILEHLGIAFQVDESLPPEVREAIDAGEKLRAIKALRQATRMSLAEAWEEVETYMAGR